MCTQMRNNESSKHNLKQTVNTVQSSGCDEYIQIRQDLDINKQGENAIIST